MRDRPTGAHFAASTAMTRLVVGCLLGVAALAACNVGGGPAGGNGGVVDAPPVGNPPADASDGNCELSGTVDAPSLQYDELSGGGATGVLMQWNASSGPQLLIHLNAGAAPFTGGVGPGVFNLASLPELPLGDGGVSVAWVRSTNGAFDSAFGARAGTFEIVSIQMPTDTADGSAHLRLTDVTLRELEPDATALLGYGKTVKPSGCTARIRTFEPTVTVKSGAG